MLVDYLNRQRAEGRCMRHELLGYVCNAIVIRARSVISKLGCGCKRVNIHVDDLPLLSKCQTSRFIADIRCNVFSRSHSFSAEPKRLALFAAIVVENVRTFTSVIQFELAFHLRIRIYTLRLRAIFIILETRAKASVDLHLLYFT